MLATATRSGVRSAFVREELKKNPRANAATVNQAWRVAGMPGEISAALVNHLRSRLGLAGNLRGRKTTRTAPGRSHAAANGTTRAPGRPSSSEMEKLEVEIDRLLMKIMAIGPLADVEDALRDTRRQLYAAMINER